MRVFAKLIEEVTMWILIFALSLFMWLSLFVAIAGAEVDLDRIAQIESSGNPLAWRKADDSRGLYQITPICLEEYNNFHPGAGYSMDDLWNVSISNEIADWYLNVRIPQMIKHYEKPVTIENVLIAYNAGIWYVKTGKPIPEITKQYLKKYLEWQGSNK
jgi:hypothetical protein